MAEYYYSSDKKKWENGGSEYDIFMNIVTGKIGLDYFIWHTEMCDTNQNHPNKCTCGAVEEAKRINETDIVPLWHFQKEGVINHYNPNIDFGTQPIRVLNHMLGLMFANTHSEFHKELFEEIDKGVFRKGVFPVLGEEALRKDNGNFRTPILDEQKNVIINETFLSYLWGVTYSVYALFLETIDFPQINNHYGYTEHPIRQENIDKAHLLFNYAKSLIQVFEKWDKEALPNPEMYSANASDRTYIEQSNTFYTEAVKFILCHEFTHAQRHIEKIGKDLPVSHYLEFEKEADENAVILLKIGMINNLNQIAVEIGIVIAVLSMFFFRKTTTGIKHPNSEDRLTSVLESLQLSESHSAWGIACIGLKLWDDQFGQNLEWETETTHKNLYYNIAGQIKDLDQNVRG